MLEIDEPNLLGNIIPKVCLVIEATASEDLNELTLSVPLLGPIGSNGIVDRTPESIIDGVYTFRINLADWPNNIEYYHNSEFILEFKGEDMAGNVILPVNEPPPALFSYEYDQSDQKIVHFTYLGPEPTTQNGITLEWDFDHYNSQSSETNPIHDFASTGSYDVVLVASNSNGSNFYSKTIEILSFGEPVIVECNTPSSAISESNR